MSPIEPQRTATASVTTAGPTLASEPTPLPVVVEGPTDAPGDGFGLVPGPATPWSVPGGPGEPTPTPTVEPTAVPLPNDALTLLGPPPGSFFRLGDVVSFFWSYQGPARPNQRFVIYLRNGGETAQLGALGAANFGDGYRLQVALDEAVGQSGEFGWLVVVEDAATGAIIGQSETRSLSVIADN